MSPQPVAPATTSSLKALDESFFESLHDENISPVAKPSTPKTAQQQQQQQQLERAEAQKWALGVLGLAEDGSTSHATTEEPVESAEAPESAEALVLEDLNMDDLFKDLFGDSIDL